MKNQNTKENIESDQKREKRVIKNNDVITINYVTYVDGKVVDTNIEKIARENNLFIDQKNTNKSFFKPKHIIVGQGMLVSGVDKFLLGKTLGRYEIEVQPKDAFGERDPSLITIIPESSLKRFNITPHIGLMIEVDGRIGIIKSCSSGRVVVDFNHIFAGKVVKYVIEVLEIKDDDFTRTNAMIEAMRLDTFIKVKKSEDGSIMLEPTKEIDDEIKQQIISKLENIGVKRISFKNTK